VIRARRWAPAVVVIGLVLLLVGCTTVRGLIDTENALRRAGYTDVDLGFDSANGFDQITLTVRPELTGDLPSGSDADIEADADAEAERAARVVWTSFGLRFDLLRVKLLGPHDGYSNTYTYSEMREIFGARPAGMDDKELGDDVVRTGVGIAIVLVVGGLLFTGAVVVAIVFGVRSSRRRKSVTPPPWPPQPT
jgi:hypothetical protein